MTLEGNLHLFFLVFARVAAVVFIAPFFSATTLSPLVRGSIIFFITVAILPGVANQLGFVPTSDSIFLYEASTDGASIVLPVKSGAEFVFLLGGEVLVGILIGLMVQLIFSVFQLAGQLFSLQMGFAASQVFDPMGQQELPLMGQFLNLAALLLFFSSNAMSRFLLTGMTHSFRAFSPSVFATVKTEFFISLMGRSLQDLFHQALLIALPIMGTLFLVSVTMGILAKTSPQMNLLMIGFPIQIAIGFLILFFSLPLIIDKFTQLIDAGIMALPGILVSPGLPLE